MMDENNNERNIKWYPIVSSFSDNDRSRTINAQIGLAETKGHRPTMEDESIVSAMIPLIHPSFNGQPGIVISMFDGHSGTEVAKHCVELLYTLVASEFERGNENESLKKIFKKCDDSLNKKTNSGSCCVLIIIVDNKIYCANVGDSEAIIVDKDGTIMNLTTIHRPTANSSEETRIRNLGGIVFRDRVYGTLAISRAFGDFSYKIPVSKHNHISVEPSIKIINIDKHYQRIIIACDGLWDVCTYKIVAYLADIWMNEFKSAQKCSEMLVHYAIQCKSTDNISVCVVELNSIKQGDTANMDNIYYDTNQIRPVNIDLTASTKDPLKTYFKKIDETIFYLL